MKRLLSILLVLILFLVTFLTACQSRDVPSNGGEMTTSNTEKTDKTEIKTEPGSDKATDPSTPPKSFRDIRNWKFSTSDLDGNPVDESIFREAKLTMVNIWATWCPPCIAEIPHIAELAKNEFADLKIQVIGIATDAEYGGDNEMVLATAKHLLEQAGATYLNVQVFYPDMYDSLLKFVEGVPTTIFVDSQGNVVGPEIVGMRTKEVFLEEAEQRLAMLGD